MSRTIARGRDARARASAPRRRRSASMTRSPRASSSPASSCWIERVVVDDEHACARPPAARVALARVGRGVAHRRSPTPSASNALGSATRELRAAAERARHVDACRRGRCDELAHDREARGRCRRPCACVEPSTWRNFSKMNGSWSAGMPAPVSSTVNDERRRPSALRLDDDLAGVGELGRVREQVEQDLPQLERVGADRLRLGVDVARRRRRSCP